MTYITTRLVDARARALVPWASAALLGVLAGISVIAAPGLLALFVGATFSVLALAVLVKVLTSAGGSNARSFVMRWTIGAFLLHLLIGSLIWSSATLTGYLGGDAITYNTGAMALLQHWLHAGPAPALPVGKKGFFYLLAAIYWTLGPHPLAGVAIDAAFAAGMIPVLYDATRRMFGAQAARYLPAIVTLLPGFLLWGSQLLREAGVYLLTAICVNCAVRLRQRVSLGPMVVLPLAAALLTTWRADVGLLVSGGLVVALALGRHKSVGGGMAGIGVGFLLLALVAGAGLGYSGYHFVTHTSLSQLNNIRADSSQSASSGYLPSANISTPSHAASYLPLGALYFLFGPFPWQIGGGRQLYGLLDALAWWILLPSLWRGIRHAWRIERRGAVFLLIPAILLAAVLSLLVANFGTTVRERMQVIVLLAPLVASGWSLRKQSGGTAVTSSEQLAPDAVEVLTEQT